MCLIQGLTVKEMEELRDDIKMHLDLDRATPTHIVYWEVFHFPSLFPLGAEYRVYCLWLPLCLLQTQFLI